MKNIYKIIVTYVEKNGKKRNSMAFHNHTVKVL